MQGLITLLEMFHGSLDEFESLTLVININEESSLEKIAASEKLSDIVAIDLHGLCKLTV